MFPALPPHFLLNFTGIPVIIVPWETREPGRLALHFGGATPPDERKEGGAMITYQDFFLFCTFIVTLISLLYQIFKGKK